MSEKILIPRNPKQEGSNVYDCRPQVGKCPNNCLQCFYNRPGAFYYDIDKPQIPSPLLIPENGIVRMNSGHDSNFQRDLVIKTALQYNHFFFNTSIPNFDFPGPVVFTANRKEEEFPQSPMAMDWPDENVDLNNLMFVRLRVSPTNLDFIERAIKIWSKYQIPVVLTFMAYYDQDPPGCEGDNSLREGKPFFIWRDPKDNRSIQEQDKIMVAYVWKKRYINSYYCPTREFMSYVLEKMQNISPRLVTMCGTLDSGYCKDCLNCQNYYYITMKRLKEMG